MGVSTNAILLYGIPLAEGTVDDYDEDDETNEAPTGKALLSALAFGGDARDGIEVETHCSDGCVMHLLAIEGSKVVAYRGSPERIDPGKLTAPKEWAEKLLAFAKECGLKKSDMEGAPGWYLASWWG